MRDFSYDFDLIYSYEGRVTTIRRAPSFHWCRHFTPRARVHMATMHSMILI